MKYGYNEAKWKDHKLFLRGEDTGIELQPVMYAIKWQDGSLSDVYNLDRAKDNAVRAEINYRNKEAPDTLEGRTRPF